MMETQNLEPEKVVKRRAGRPRKYPEGLHKRHQLRVKVYFDKESFLDVALEAEKSGCRRKGLEAFVHRENGFKDEMMLNTDGISTYLKQCHEFYKKNNGAILEKRAAAIKKKEEAEAELKQLG